MEIIRENHIGGVHARVAHSTVQISAEWRALFNFVATRTRYGEATKDTGEDTGNSELIRRLLIYDKTSVSLPPRERRGTGRFAVSSLLPHRIVSYGIVFYQKGTIW